MDPIVADTQRVQGVLRVVLETGWLLSERLGRQIGGIKRKFGQAVCFEDVRLEGRDGTRGSALTQWGGVGIAVGETRRGDFEIVGGRPRADGPDRWSAPEGEVAGDWLVDC